MGDGKWEPETTHAVQVVAGRVLFKIFAGMHRLVVGATPALLAQEQDTVNLLHSFTSGALLGTTKSKKQWEVGWWGDAQGTLYVASTRSS